MAETSFIVRMDAELLHKLDYICQVRRPQPQR